MGGIIPCIQQMTFLALGHCSNHPGFLQSPMVHNTNSCISCSKTICKKTRNCTHKNTSSSIFIAWFPASGNPTHISTIASPFFSEQHLSKSIYRHRWDLLKSHIPHLSMFSWRFSQFFTWFPSAWKPTSQGKLTGKSTTFPEKVCLVAENKEIQRKSSMNFVCNHKCCYEKSKLVPCPTFESCELFKWRPYRTGTLQDFVEHKKDIIIYQLRKWSQWLERGLQLLLPSLVRSPDPWVMRHFRNCAFCGIS